MQCVRVGDRIAVDHEDVGVEPGLGSLHWPLGQLADLLGRTGQALDHFARAVTLNTRLGARPSVVLTRLDRRGHIRSILAKLQLTNRTELAAWALRETGS